MGEVVTKFTGDTKDLEAAYARLQKEVLKLKDEHVKLKKESKDGGAAMKGALSDAVSEAGQLVAGMFTVQAAVGFAKSEYDAWGKSIDALAAKNKEFEQGLIRTLQKSGDLAKAGDIQKWLGSISGATREQGRTALDAVSGATPASSLGRRQALAGALAPLAPTGIDLAQAGGVAGELSDMMPGKSAGDIADIVAKLQSKTGSDFAKFAESSTLRAMQALVTSGAAGSPEQAMGLGVAAHDANLKPEILSRLAEAATKSFERGEIKTNAIAKFSRGSPSERMAMLQNDPTIAKEILGDEAGLKFAMLPGDAAATRTSELLAAQSGDYAQQAVAELGQSDVGLKALSQQSTAMRADANAQGYWAQRSQRWNETTSMLNEAGLPAGSWGSRMASMKFSLQGGGTEAQIGALEGQMATLNGPNGRDMPGAEGMKQYLMEQVAILRRIENQNKRPTVISQPTEQ